MDIKIDHPLVILKDRLYNKKGEIRGELNQVHITATKEKKKGRWRKQPDREIQLNTMVVQNKGLSLQYTASDTMSEEVFTVLPPSNFTVEKESIQWSPFLDQH